MGILDLRWEEPRFTTLVNNGNPNNRLDIAIIGDGYTRQQQRVFNEDVNSIINAFRTTEPMQTYFLHFNFHRINLFSPQDGTDDIHNSITRATALDTFYSPISERRLVGPDPWVMTVVTMSGAPWDTIIVVVNSPRRGGGTLPTLGVAYASRNSNDFPQIAIHEAGHSIAKLMDEYSSGLPDIDFADGWSLPTVVPWPNVDNNARNPKWRVWLSSGVALPTPEVEANANLIGAFQGAAYENFGVYRPQLRCLMNGPGAGSDPTDWSSPNFCTICSEQWIRAIYEKSKLADFFIPRFNLPQPPLLRNENTQITFNARVVRRNVRATWFTKRIEQTQWNRRQRTDTFSSFQTTLRANRVLGVPVPTYWLVRCLLEDQSGQIRMPAIRRLATQEHVWHIITSA